MQLIAATVAKDMWF